MKFYIELAIAAVLLLLVFDKPANITELSTTMLGKTVLVIAVACVAKYRGLGAGLMAALIMLILLHDGREGLENRGKEKGMKKKNKKEEKTTTTAPSRTRSSAPHPTPTTTRAANNTKGKPVEPFTTISDIRMTEGMMNMNSYSEGMASSKFSNGYTGNRPMFKGLI